MEQGYLLIETFIAKGNIPINEVQIMIFGEDLDSPIEVYTNRDGKSEVVALPAKNKEYSLEESYNDRPYSEYTIKATKEGYYEINIKDIQIFAGEYSYLPLNLIPLQSTINERTVPVATQITPHNLNTQNTPRNEIGGGPSPTSLYNPVIIPSTITVHLGRPEQRAEDLTVDFRYYIKNVASSEIYPTWPKEAITANILAIISLALNRVYTEWYKLRGYPFQITNSTSFDQAFVKDRNIFDSISDIVDEVFNEYVRRIGYIEPLFTQYCDGKRVQCEGMKQWGSYALANQGYNAVEILKEYYGENIEVVICNTIEDIRESYPGSPLQIGSSGKDVYLMQRYLNRISIDYPNIPSTHPQNGIFTRDMEESVKAFQEQFNLLVDGIIGKSTWYKISYIFTSVTKLAELSSEGYRVSNEYYKYPGTALKEGNRGIYVYALQVYLALISQFYETIDTPTIDSVFGRTTKNIVIQFQKEFGLEQDGVVGESTWNKIVEVFLGLLDQIPPMDEILMYPGYLLEEGARGENVAAIQTYLNKIAEYYPNIPRVQVDGIFGRSTVEQVKAFQRVFNLRSDGVIGEMTWNAILLAYQELLRVTLYPGSPLGVGSQGESVRKIQEYIREIASVYKDIPTVQVDGTFGPATKRAVESFQAYFGLPVDGVVGKNTWNKILEVYINDIREIIREEGMDSVYDAVFDTLGDLVQYHTKDRVGK
ncbi:MAG: peptidoglycan-binding protein [Erysipelotrichales bacterium]|nr:peptidoglycan-binding protein [Erysipelotrichales bacterium]